MQSFKKVLFKSIMFVLCILIVSSPFLLFYITGGTRNNFPSDTKEDINKYIGKTDTIFIGASLGHQAFIPSIFDDKLNCNSFNYCSDGLSMHARYHLLKKYIDENPVKTVIMDVSYDTMTRMESGTIDSKMRVLEKLDNFSDKAGFILDCCEFDDVPVAYYYALSAGLVNIKNHIKVDYLGQNIYNFREYYDKGYVAVKKSMTFPSEEEYLTSRNTKEFEVEILDKHLAYLSEIVNLTKEKNIELILVSTPVSDYFTNKHVNNDDIYGYYSSFCEDNNIKYYNFNLLKNKSELFPDNGSYMDETHMTYRAAVTFSEKFSEVIESYQMGEDDTKDFYSSFAEMYSNTK